MMQTRGPAGAKAAAPCCLQSYISPKAATRSRPHLAATTRDIPGPAGARSPGVPELRPLPALWNPDLCPGEQEVCSSGRSVAEVQSVAPRWLPGGHCHEEDDNKIEKRYISWWKSWKSEGSPAASSPCCSVPRAPSAQRSLAVVEAVMLNLTTGWLYAISATRISFQIKSVSEHGGPNSFTENITLPEKTNPFYLDSNKRRCSRVPLKGKSVVCLATRDSNKVSLFKQ